MGFYMKRKTFILLFVSILAVFAALCSACGFTPNEPSSEEPSPSQEEAEEVENTDGIDYQLSEDGKTAYLYTVGEFRGSELTVAETYKGKPVTRIETYAFSGCDFLKSVKIPEGVTEIGFYAFYECTALERVELPASIRALGENVFYYDILKETETPLKIYYAGSIDGWAQISFDSPVLDSNLYINGKLVTEINLTSAKKVSDYAFCGLSCLKSVTLGDSVKEIGEMAFRECVGLNSVAMANGVTNIGDSAFAYCKNLKNVEMSEKLTSIGACAFEACERLVKVEVPDDVSEIGDYAFFNCIALTSAKIGKNVNTIGGDAFKNCYKLVEIINESDSLKITKKSEENGCAGYYALTIHKGESMIKIVDDYIFITCKTSADNYKTDKTYLLGYTGDESDLVLPDDYNGVCYNVYSYAFYCRTDLKSVKISDKTSTVMWHSFDGCSSLREVIIGKNVSIFGDCVFYDCENLTSITLPNTLTDIAGANVFVGCRKLAEVVNNSDVTYNFLTFSGSSSTYNKYVLYVHKGESEIKSAGDFSFITVNGTNYLIDYVGTDENVVLPQSYNDEKYVIYDCAFRNCDFIKNVTFNGNIIQIGDFSFENCSALTSVTLPRGITRIGKGAFSGCEFLKSVELSDTVSYIGESAFDYCYALKKANYIGTIEQWTKIRFDDWSANPAYYAGDLYIKGKLVEDVTSNEATGVSAYAFYNCSSIKSVTLTKAEGVSDYAFCMCKKLESVTFSGKMKFIGKYAFSECEKLKSVSFAGEIYQIDAGAFYGCKSLKSMDLSSGISEIFDYAFEDCDSLETVKISDGIYNIGRGVFRNTSVKVIYLGTSDKWEKVTKNSDWALDWTINVEFKES